jgi:hypothetical protein
MNERLKVIKYLIIMLLIVAYSKSNFILNTATNFKSNQIKFVNYKRKIAIMFYFNSKT